MALSHCWKSSFFVQKFNFDFPRKLSIFFGWKTRENGVVLDFLAVGNFDFTRKIVKKIWVKNSWKCWVFVKIGFSDKTLTFRIVCFSGSNFSNKKRKLCLIVIAINEAGIITLTYTKHVFMQNTAFSWSYTYYVNVLRVFSYTWPLYFAFGDIFATRNAICWKNKK